MPSDRATLEEVRAVPLFEHCSEETLAKVAEAATQFEVEKGHVLIHREQPGAGLFILREGTVIVELPHEKIELGEGEFFGELALLTEEAGHAARVSATSRVRGLALARDDLESLLHSDAEMAVNMLKVVAGRLARAEHP